METTLFEQIFRPLAPSSALAQYARRDFAEHGGNSWPCSVSLDDGIQRKLWLAYFEASVHAILLPYVDCATGPFVEVDLSVLFAHTGEIWDAETGGLLKTEIPEGIRFGSLEGRLWWVSKYLESIACLDATNAQELKHVTWNALQPVNHLLTAFEIARTLVAHNRAILEIVLPLM